VLTNPVVTIGDLGGNVVTNITPENPNANPIGFSITSFAGANGTIAAVNNQTLVKITFTVVAGAPTGTTDLTFGDTPARRRVSGTDPNMPLPQPSFTNGTVLVSGATAAGVSVSGRVMSAQGKGITNVVVAMTDSSGNTRTTVTASLGVYRFTDVAAGETYVISVAAKRFKFNQPSQVLNINDETENINFIGTGTNRTRVNYN
jgi:hypothetical protein